jgi:hypothetical protein
VFGGFKDATKVDMVQVSAVGQCNLYRSILWNAGNQQGFWRTSAVNRLANSQGFISPKTGFIMITVSPGEN